MGAPELSGYQARVHAAFSAAEGYDDAARVQRRVATDLARRIAACRAGSPPARILEIGCGTGGLTRLLRALWPDADMLATDLSPAMIARARARPALETVRFAVMDAARPDRHERFDLICSSLCLQWLKDPGAALSRLGALLAPGGLLAVSMLGAGSFDQWRACCAAEGAKTGFPDYPDDAALRAIAPPALRGGWTRIAYDDPVGDGLSFLRDLRRIGAQTPRRGFLPQRGTTLRRILRRFDEGERLMRYETVYGLFAKDDCGGTGNDRAAPCGVFVTGTDTGVGKTLVSAILAQAWGAEYWKPLQTGLGEEPGDTPLVADLAQVRTLAPVYALSEPLSPLAAADAEGVVIDPALLRLPRRDDATPLVVEGAGGLMVPITPDMMMIDLIGSLGLPVVLVARSSLGTINHTLLSLQALRAAGIPFAGLILNGPLNEGNARALARFGGVPILVQIPHATVVDRAFIERIARDVPPLAAVLRGSGTAGG